MRKTIAEIIRAARMNANPLGQVGFAEADALIAKDVVKVVRCKDCIHAVPFDRNCELNTSAYLHCGLLRGEEVKYVWHKYKKYYKDYSVVDRDGFCDSGEKMNGKGEGE